jgi:hypothetical protein
VPTSHLNSPPTKMRARADPRHRVGRSRRWRRLASSRTMPDASNDERDAFPRTSVVATATAAGAGAAAADSLTRRGDTRRRETKSLRDKSSRGRSAYVLTSAIEPRASAGNNIAKARRGRRWGGQVPERGFRTVHHSLLLLLHSRSLDSVYRAGVCSYP